MRRKLSSFTTVLALVLLPLVGRASPPSSLQFPDGDADVVIPLVRDHDRVFARLTAKGHDLGYFVVDTGSEITTLPPDIAARLGLRSVGRREVDTQFGLKPFGVATLRQLELGGAVLANHVVYLDPAEVPAGVGGRAGGGVLGMDVLGAVPVTIDLRTPALVLHRPGRFRFPPGQPTFPLQGLNAAPTVEAEVDGREGWFALDTATGNLLVLSYEFVRLNRDLVLSRPTINETGPWGKPMISYASRWSSLRFLGREFTDVQAGQFRAARGGLETVAGLLGASAFRDALLTIDTAERRIAVEWPEPDKEPAEALVARLTAAGKADLGGATPLLHAAFRLRADAVRLLLEDGADPEAADAGGITPLMVAAGRGDAATASALLAKRASLTARSNSDGYTPLLLAARYGRKELVDLLLDAGADINLSSDSGRTPLFGAADAAHAAAVERLLARGAAVDQPLGTGETPLTAACQAGCAEVVAALLKAGADPNAQGDSGTPLSYAARNGAADCVRLLVEAGARVNGGTRSGHTPLGLAAGYYQGAACVEVLLSAGADPEAADAQGLTPLDHALASGSPESIRLLLVRLATRPATREGGED